MATKHIADPVHGAIDLEQIELDLIDTPTFQRLRRIKQLAMASQVYPGADHSRFLHSLGVFSIMCRLVERLVASNVIPDEDVRTLRVAALLHDVGHYPYSHLLEKVPLPPVEASPEESEIVEVARGSKLDTKHGEFPKHEELSETIICGRSDVRSVLESWQCDPNEVVSVILGNHGKAVYNQLLTSGLDVDRMDYMLRDAHYTGVPYGRIDLDYILRNLELDNQDRLCVNAKAVPSVEHFLLSRWYNYGQIVFQKTVMGMECLMKELLRRMVETGLLPSSQADIRSIILDEREFLRFDDIYVDSRIRELAARENTDPTTVIAQAAVSRVKPRCVFEGLADVVDGQKDERVFLFTNEKQIPAQIPQWAKTFGPATDYWLMADSGPRTIGELKPQRTLSDEERDPEDSDENQKSRAKLIRVKEADRSSSYILDKESSLLWPLRHATFRVMRMFVLFPDEVRATYTGVAQPAFRDSFKERAQHITAHITNEMGLT